MVTPSLAATSVGSATYQTTLGCWPSSRSDRAALSASVTWSLLSTSGASNSQNFRSAAGPVQCHRVALGEAAGADDGRGVRRADGQPVRHRLVAVGEQVLVAQAARLEPERLLHRVGAPDDHHRAGQRCPRAHHGERAAAEVGRGWSPPRWCPRRRSRRGTRARRARCGRRRRARRAPSPRPGRPWVRGCGGRGLRRTGRCRGRPRRAPRSRPRSASAEEQRRPVAAAARRGPGGRVRAHRGTAATGPRRSVAVRRAGAAQRRLEVEHLAGPLPGGAAVAVPRLVEDPWRRPPAGRRTTGSVVPRAP